MQTVGTPALWLGFIALVLAMLALDLGVFHRTAHAVGAREAAVWSAIWVALAAGFTACVHAWFGPEHALEFATGYLIEKALAVDNIFVFVIIFGAFGVSPAHQHRVLFWGIVGALLMRGAFIFAGGAFLQKFHWAIYVFGALLIGTGVKLLVQRDKEQHPERNPLVLFFHRLLPVDAKGDGPRFTVVRNGRRFATPLLLALLTVEFSDVIFAVDSIPAIFAVTTDPFIVFTSNIFAILGLRSLYFLLAGVVHRFRYLSVAMSVILVFVGTKMVLADVVRIPVAASLGAIALVLAAAVAASLLRSPAPGPAAKLPL